jgi:hypothetical protein
MTIKNEDSVRVLADKVIKKFIKIAKRQFEMTGKIASIGIMVLPTNAYQKYDMDFVDEKQKRLKLVQFEKMVLRNNASVALMISEIAVPDGYVQTGITKAMSVYAKSWTFEFTTVMPFSLDQKGAVIFELPYSDESETIALSNCF